MLAVLMNVMEAPMSHPTAADLGRIPMLASLDTAARERLAARLDVVEYADGERIVIEGTSGSDVFVIDSGRATATQRERGLVGLLGPGDFFGEIALLGKSKRNATITASTPMVVWVLRGDAMQSLQREYPEVANALSTAMQDRLARG